MQVAAVSIAAKPPPMPSPVVSAEVIGTQSNPIIPVRDRE